MSRSPARYRRYSDVPTHRKQWFFWLNYLTCPPFALAILISGDVYYVKRGLVRNFGMLNRLVAGLLAVPWMARLTIFVIEHMEKQA